MELYELMARYVGRWVLQLCRISFPLFPALTLGRLLALILVAPILYKLVGLIFAIPMSGPREITIPPERKQTTAIVRRTEYDSNRKL